MNKFLIFRADTWQEIYHSLRKNKLRTFLTMIGVGWGMFLYVGLLGTAKGLENSFNKNFEGVATNSMFVWGQQTEIPYKGFPRGRQMRLTLRDVEFLKQNVPEIEVLAPRNVAGIFGSAPSPTIRNGKKGTYQVFGDYPYIDKIAKKRMSYGRFLNNEDIEQNRKVAVIGKQILEQLFEKNENPIGKYIQISGVYFQVIGVYKARDNGGFERDNSIFMPFTTFQKLYNQGENIGWLAITAKPEFDIKATEFKIKKLLRERNNVSFRDGQAYGSFNLGEFYQKISGFLVGMQFLTWIVGFLTILAGVIAISNILLITVKERTKEIGIRRALGAKPSDIRSQILIESVVITLFSGLSGLILGTMVLSLLNSAMLASEDPALVNPTVNLANVFLALVVMITLGLVIGLIPAERAVQIRPIEALRTE